MRCLTMACKGVVVVPERPASWPGDGAPGTQRVANRAIVCHVVDALRAAGSTEIAVVGEAESLAQMRAALEADAEVDISYLEHCGRTPILDTLLAAAAFVGEEPCLIHSAAGLLGQPLTGLAMLERENADLLLLLHRSATPAAELEPHTERLLGISQLRMSKTRLSLAGACLFSRSTLSELTAQADRLPAAARLSALAELIAGGGRRVRASLVPEWCAYTGSCDELLELNRLVLDQQRPEGEPFEQGDNRIEGRVVIHPSAQVSSSVILGPSIIGAGAHVANSYIGPYTSIGADTWIEGVEIGRSIILDGARVMHVGGRIEASTVGRRARIIRNFALPRGLRLHVGEAVEVVLN